MIGVEPAVPRQVTAVPIPPGTLLCFYTDGLIERPGEIIDDGMERLRRAVAAQAPDMACSVVMGALVGNEPARDDIALLMIRCQPDRAEARIRRLPSLAREEVSADV